MVNFSDFVMYPASYVSQGNIQFALFKNPRTNTRKLWISTESPGYLGEKIDSGIFCELTHQNADALRREFEWLIPQPLGLEKSFGFGDRLGLATPGHILSAVGRGIHPVFAQQSVRENARTGRTPFDVMDDAMWGVFQMGWREPWGADADHLKNPEVMVDFVKAGFTMFTVDPGDHVDQHADQYTMETLIAKKDTFPWEKLKISPDSFYRDWLGKEIPALGLTFDEQVLLRALSKYGRAIIHTYEMFLAVREAKGGSPFDFEVSVDETDSPTSLAEHYFIASELRRLGVKWTSLAPRFIGRFEKGVDYIGDLSEFDQSVKAHAEIARHFGEYKISLHSGSDKFSVYPSVNRYTDGKLHVKTAGTSYLEALRVVAQTQPALFAEILAFSCDRYEVDKATYHVSGELRNVPRATIEPESLLDQFDARQVFHVTYGSVLAKFNKQIFDVLKVNEEAYAKTLKKHFAHHLDLLS